MGYLFRVKRKTAGKRVGQRSSSSVLVAINGRECDKEVVRLGCELLTSRSAKLYLLSVIEVERGLPGDKEIPPATARAEEVLQRAEEVARPYKRSVEAYVRQTRRAGVAVVREAVDKGVGTIVLGLQYKERFGSFTLGDTIPYVLEHAPCRVIVWRDPLLENGTATP